MLKQGVKTIEAEFTRTRALSQLSVVQFGPYATFFLGLLLSLMLMSKRKMILETSLDLKPSFKTSVDARVEDLVSNVDYFKNWRCNFSYNMEQKDVCRAHKFHSLDLHLSFCTNFLHR